MKISSIGCDVLANLICDDDIKYKYRTKAELETLFFGKVDFEEAKELTRKKFTIYCLSKTNNLEKILIDISDFRNFENNSRVIAKEFAEKINDIISVDGYKLIQGLRGLYKIDTFEKEKLVETKLHNKVEILSVKCIEEHLTKIDKKIKENDYSGAITNSRTLIEQVIKDLSEKLNVEYIGSDLNRSFSNIRKAMNLEPQNYEHDGFKKIIIGLINIIGGIAEVRNRVSDSHATIYKPSKHHAVLCANSAKTFCDFIVESYLYQTKST